MLKALIRKHMAEVGSHYFRDKKSGKQKIGKGRKGIIILLTVLYIAMGLSFGALSALFFSTTVPIGADWLGWTLVAIIGILMSVLINAFLSYSQLYAAKDNELLLAMPIPPSEIVKSKLVGIYVMGLIYFGMVWPFSMIFYFFQKGITLKTVVFPLIMFFVIGILILAFTCILAWIIAGIMNRLKGRKFISVALAAIMIIALYGLQIYSNKLFTSIAKNTSTIAEVFQDKAYPLYLIGTATAGNVMSLLIFTIAVFLLMAIVFYLLNKTFIKIATTKRSVKKVEYKETKAKEATPALALMRKEKLRFTGSINYMLNCGFGILFAAAIVILSLVKKDFICDKIDEIGQYVSVMDKLLPVAIAIAVSSICSTIDISAPSVSLEGKSIWVLQSMPVDPYDVLMAKFKFCLRIQGTCGFIMALAMSLAVALSPQYTTALIAFVIAFSFFSSIMGVVANCKKPNVSWTNEIVPIKQGMSVAIVLFGGWLVSFIIIGIYFAVMKFVSPDIYLMIWAIFLLMLFSYCKKWLKNKGTEIFARL